MKQLKNRDEIDKEQFHSQAFKFYIRKNLFKFTCKNGFVFFHIYYPPLIRIFKVIEKLLYNNDNSYSIIKNLQIILSYIGL